MVSDTTFRVVGFAHVFFLFNPTGRKAVASGQVTVCTVASCKTGLSPNYLGVDRFPIAEDMSSECWGPRSALFFYLCLAWMGDVMTNETLFFIVVAVQCLFMVSLLWFPKQTRGEETLVR